MVLRGLTQLLHNKSEGRRIVLFVDNAHDLDELSSMMVAQLSAGAHVTLLAACVDMPHVGGDIMGLWKDDLLRRVDLGPFDFAETAATLHHEYGGRFSLTAARALWSASGGNALFLHSLAREQIKLGTVVRQDGVWFLGNGPIALTGEIRDVVKARLNRLGTGQRDVFELLALAGAVPLQTLMLIGNPQDMDALQERALIRVTHDHPPMVRVANPVTAGIVASVVPPGRSAELRRRLDGCAPGIGRLGRRRRDRRRLGAGLRRAGEPGGGPGRGPHREQRVRSRGRAAVRPGGGRKRTRRPDCHRIGECPYLGEQRRIRAPGSGSAG